MKKIVISLFSLALLIVPCSCGDDDNDNDNENRQEVNKDDSNKENGNGGDNGKETKPDGKEEFSCHIEPLKRNLYFAGEDEVNVYVQSNRSLADLTIYIKDEEGKKHETEMEFFYNYIRVHTPDVSGKLSLVVADTDGTHPQQIEFYNLDEKNNHSILAYIETPYIDLQSGKALTKEEADAQPGKAWLKLDETKGIIGAEGISVVFDDNSSSLDQTGEVRQFKLSNGQEGLIVLITISYKEGKKNSFAFSYCLR
jgi:hypothetical protein